MSREWTFRHKNGTYLQILNGCGVDVADLSVYNNEGEVLILPGATFQVLNIFKRGGPSAGSQYTYLTAQHLSSDAPSTAIPRIVTAPDIFVMNTVLSADVIDSFSLEVKWHNNQQLPLCLVAPNICIRVSKGNAKGHFTAFPEPWATKSTSLGLGSAHINSEHIEKVIGVQQRSTHYPWICGHNELLLLPGTKYKLQLEVRPTGGHELCWSYPITVELAPTIPPLVLHTKAELAHTFQEPFLGVEFTIPHNGGAEIQEVRLVVFKQMGKELRNIGCMPIEFAKREIVQQQQRRRVLPHWKWEGHTCRFAVAVRNFIGWNFDPSATTAGAAHQVLSPPLRVPWHWQFKPIADKQKREVFKTGLKGRNPFVPRGAALLQKSGLFLDSMPFGSKPFTIREWLQINNCAPDEEMRTCNNNAMFTETNLHVMAI